MVQFLSINFYFLGFLQFLLGFSKVPVFFVSPCTSTYTLKTNHRETCSLCCLFFLNTAVRRVGGFRRLGVSCVKMVCDECCRAWQVILLEISIILLIDHAPTSPFLFAIPAISLAGLESKCTHSIDVNSNSVILSDYLI